MSMLLTEKVTPNILQVTLNRPQSRNAINHDMMLALCELWKDLRQNSSHLRCIILTGTAPAFCAGADLKERKEMPLDVWRKQREALEQSMIEMIQCPIPIIAAVNGAAFGGGLELVLASDFAYASSDASFSQSEVKMGIMPGAMGTQHLARACGLARAKELTMTGQIFSADQAYVWGIVNQVCSTDTLLEHVILTAKSISDNAPLAVCAVKKAIAYSHASHVLEGFDVERKLYDSVLQSHDRLEGIAAFNEKRKPYFKGE